MADSETVQLSEAVLEPAHGVMEDCPRSFLPRLTMAHTFSEVDGSVQATGKQHHANVNYVHCCAPQICFSNAVSKCQILLTVTSLPVPLNLHIFSPKVYNTCSGCSFHKNYTQDRRVHNADKQELQSVWMK